MVVNDTSAPAATHDASAAAARKKSPVRRKKASVRKRPAARRTISAARASNAGALQSLLTGLSRKAARTGTRIAAISEEGFSGARHTLEKAGTASKKTINRLTREWKQMDTKKRAQFIAALLGALAAASAPLVGRRLKKK